MRGAAAVDGVVGLALASFSISILTRASSCFFRMPAASSGCFFRMYSMNLRFMRRMESFSTMHALSIVRPSGITRLATEIKFSEKLEARLSLVVQMAMSGRWP